MPKFKEILNQHLVGRAEGVTRDRGNPDIFGGIAGGAIAGSLGGLLAGTKTGRNFGKNALAYGGTALLGGLPYKAWRHWQSGKPIMKLGRFRTLSKTKKSKKLPFLLLIPVLFQVNPVFSMSNDLIERQIIEQIGSSSKLQDTRIDVHVQDRLVVLAGQVRLYNQKLVSGRIAWTTTGVFEVDNEIRVMPRSPLSKEAIERKIRKIVRTDERYSAAGLVIRVNNGEVFIKGKFLGYRDPWVLKHKVAEIEGVVDIEISAEFIARSRDPGKTGE